MVTLTVVFASSPGVRAADKAEAEKAAAEKFLATVKAKETHAQDLRSAAATAQQKAADDEMEAAAEERDARILTATALSLLKADANRQKAFELRHAAQKLMLQARRKAIEGRNAEHRAAQHTQNADELTKAVAQVKDQASIAGSLQNDAKEQAAEAQSSAQAASQAKSEAQILEKRAVAMWAAADKLDPETKGQLPGSNATVVEPRTAK